MSRPAGGSPYLPLALAVVCISTGSIFVRMASAPALAVAFYRIFLASALLAPFAAASALRTWPALPARARALLVASGVALGVHFGQRADAGNHAIKTRFVGIRQRGFRFNHDSSFELGLNFLF